jgi:F-box-like
MAPPIFCDRCGDTVAGGCDPLDELAQLDALLERLTLKRYDLKRKINQIHSPIVRQLPPDVISTVFEFCLPDFADFQRFPFNVDLCFPLSLGAICSYWREIAWSTPCLWSSLAVYVSGPGTAAIAQEWLARSGQLPLSIRIDSEFSRSLRQALSELADVINQYSNRWSDLHFHIPRSFYQLFQATGNHAPILKSIRFHCGSYAAVNFHLTCPRLESADLACFQLHGTNIEWDNLTHLNLDRMSITDSLLILRNTSRLVFCKISNILQLEEEEPSMTILPSLRSLQMTTYFDEHLNNLITPCWKNSLFQ